MKSQTIKIPNDMEENKYFQNSQVVTIMRSEIKLSDYNPRKITAEGKKELKKSIKKFGVVGGLIVNKQTGNTIVGGHQKVAVLDELNKYDPNVPETDYQLRVELVDVDLKTEKTMNIVLNNPNVGGDFDYDKLAQIVPDIDYKDAGLTDADLSMIGLDYLLHTEKQNSMNDALQELMKPAQDLHDAEIAARQAQREAEKAIREQEAEDEIAQQSANAEQIAREEAERAAKVQHMKDVKAEVRQQAIENAQNMDAYVVLSFSTFNAKAEFVQRFGYNAMERTIKGEDFDARLEDYFSDAIDDNDYEDE